jgi:hypothetical protein
MLRAPKEEGYEVIAISLSILLIFGTLFLSENQFMRGRGIPQVKTDVSSIPVTTFGSESVSTTSALVSSTRGSIETRVPAVESSETTVTSPKTSTTLAPVNPEMYLSDLQIDACFTADVSGVCTTKLNGLGIVELGECCKYLGRCCL